MRGKTFRVVQWIVAVGIVIGLVAALAGCAPEESGAGDVVGQGYVSGDGSVQTYDVGDRKGPVAIEGTDFEGEDVDTADWAGDVVVVNTWYASCAPCRAEAPDLVDLASSKEGVQFLGINTEDEAGAAQAFQRTFEVPYPSVEDRSGAVIAGLAGVVPLQAVPTTVILDQEGYVAARVVGQAEVAALEALIDDVLAEAA